MSSVRSQVPGHTFEALRGQLLDAAAKDKNIGSVVLMLDEFGDAGQAGTPIANRNQENQA